KEIDTAVAPRHIFIVIPSEARNLLFVAARRLSPHCSRQNLFDVDNVGRITSRITSRAIRNLLPFAARLPQALQREISQRIRANVVANLIDRLIGGDELLFRRSIHAVITRRDRLRTRESRTLWLV